MQRKLPGTPAAYWGPAGVGVASLAGDGQHFGESPKRRPCRVPLPLAARPGRRGTCSNLVNHHCNEDVLVNNAPGCERDKAPRSVATGIRRRKAGMMQKTSRYDHTGTRAFGEREA